MIISSNFGTGKPRVDTRAKRRRSDRVLNKVKPRPQRKERVRYHVRALQLPAVMVAQQMLPRGEGTPHSPYSEYVSKEKKSSR